MGRNRSGVLELAVLGLLNGTPMHGYELRKRLYTVLGAFRALSYGSLYPCLHELQAAGLITEDEPEPAPAPTGTARARAGQRIRSTCIGSIHRGDLTVRSNGPKYRSEALNRHVPGYHELLGEAWDATAPAYSS